MTESLEMRVHDSLWNDTLEVLLRLPERNHTTGLFSIVTSMTLETKEIGVMVDPSFHLSHEHAKKLMNQLWHAGIRPTEVKDSTALEAHLSDMRLIAFNRLKINVG